MKVFPLFLGLLVAIVRADQTPAIPTAAPPVDVRIDGGRSSVIRASGSTGVLNREWPEGDGR